MKKIIALFLCVFLLVGCGSTTASKPEDVVKSFLENSKKSDWETALNYVDISKEDKDDFINELLEEYLLGSDSLDTYKALFTFDYKIKSTEVDEEKASVIVEVSTYDFESIMTSLLSKIMVEMLSNPELLEMDDEEGALYVAGLLEDLLKTATKDITIETELNLKKDGKDWKLTQATVEAFRENIFSGAATEYDYDYTTYPVDSEKVKAENTLLGKGRLVDSIYNEKWFETRLEFIDINVVDGNGIEISEYNALSFDSGKVKVEVEIAGQIGDRFTVSILDDEYNIIIVETYELTSAQQVVSIETTIDPSFEDLSIEIYPESDYLQNGIYANQVGFFYIWNE